MNATNSSTEWIGARNFVGFLLFPPSLRAAHASEVIEFIARPPPYGEKIAASKSNEKELEFGAVVLRCPVGVRYRQSRLSVIICLLGHGLDDNIAHKWGMTAKGDG
jgi:hypothetical protein